MIRHRRSFTAAAALALGAVATAVFGFAAPASAHVTVNPKDATQGGYARIAFRVPNESDTASTTKVEVVLPENAPVGSVSTMPVPGWTVAVEKRKVDPPVEVHGSQLSEVVSKLTWTATANAGVKPGEFQEFPVSLGPLPQVDRMVFKTLQTYSDGNVQRWIEEPTPGGEEPESPAPVLTLTAAGASASPTAGARADDDDDDDEVEAEGVGVATGLGIAGLVAGAAGLLLGGLAFARTRREATPKS
ncbi:YcnI family protein [Micromonospora sp. C28SCA-DRY-2]|uniref:YcnI family copper-binding membrane protein n=1 Tax=Micromonospora sp. C28SCA-DRY-2 TaxID=3059522 RepID=UPI002675713A|nr:YcnI family protein [Micromonospora sp. C28SCA-DRY-2]MDO3700835.1 YcnI family protein [Micromonospora sp. C28SCA-DRY-2]